MYCELCRKPIDPNDNYHIDTYVNLSSGIPRNVYVHANGSCPDADIEMYTKVCPTCKSVFETYDNTRTFCCASCANHERYEQAIHVIRDRYITSADEKRDLVQKLKDDMKQAMTDLRATQPIMHRSATAKRPDSIQPRVTPEMHKAPRNAAKVTSFTVRNEQGVVWMFSKMAKMVGWELLDIRAAFPDATFVNAAGQRLEVEFEYKSSNFVAHKHDPAGCDFVVCWTNDMELDGVEVLVLDAL